MTPVALFTYNRSQNLQRTLDCLKNNKLDLLYIFSDGPKDEADAEKIKEVRKILDRIDWVKTEKVYQKKNLGLSASVISGVNKILEKYGQIICVEDDVCVAPDFYGYMEACLEKYQNDPKIAGVTALRYPLPEKILKNYPYDVFSFPRFSSWGWGTWKKFWQTVDFDQAGAAKKIETAKLDASPAGEDMKGMVEALVKGTLHGGWDVFCAAAMLLNKQSFIWPTWNMVENSGFSEGTHASGKPSSWQPKWEKKENLAAKNLKFPTTEPEQKNIQKALKKFFKRKAGISSLKKTMNALRKLKKIAKKILGRSAGKPNPKEYSTIVGAGSFVPCQMEAYFLCLNKYVREGDKVLDVGFGLGYGLNTLAIKAGEVSGVDIDEKVLKYCLETTVSKNPKLKELKVYDGYKLDFPDNSFDIVSCVDTLEHVEDYNRFLKELLRVSRRGIFISTPNKRPEYTNPDGTPKNYWHLREWTWEELDKILKSYGKVDWNFLNGPFSGPFTISEKVADNSLTLSPFVFKNNA